MLGLLIFLNGVTGNYLENLGLETGSVCSSYSCAQAAAQKPSTSSCLWLNTTSTTSYYLWPCDSNLDCNTTSGKCEAPQSSVSGSHIGGPCSSTIPCLSGACTNSKCRGFQVNEKCSAHSQCDSSLRCYSGNNTCQPQLKVGETGCRSYLDCVNWATCNLTSSSSKGNCVEYGSVAIGRVVNDCVNGFSYMCSMGSCTKTGIFSTLAVCNYPPVSNAVNPKACNADSDCQGSMNGQVVTSKCGCGINPYGLKYCMPFIGDIAGQNMIRTWNKALKMGENCNTAERSSESCMNAIGMLKNTTQATLLYYGYPKYQSNDDCIKVNINNDYWFEGSEILGFGLVLIALVF